MKCEECRKLLSNYLDDPSSRDAAGVRGHIAACAACAAELRRLSEVDRMVRDRATPAAPDALRRETVERVKAAVRAKHGASTVIAFPRWAWAAAAAVLLVSAIVLYGRRERPEPAAKPDAPVAEADLVDRLVSANLALAEAEAPADRAKVFNQMAKCFYENFLGAAAIGDGEEAAFSVDNFERLIRDGVMANVRQAGTGEHKPDLVSLQSALAGYCAGAKRLEGEGDRQIAESAGRLIVAARSAEQDTQRILKGI